MELSILHFLESCHTAFFNVFWYIITMFGESGIFWIVLALLFLIFFPKKWRKVGMTMGFALIFSLILCNLILKPLVARDRPFWVDPTLLDTRFQLLVNYMNSCDDCGFPSGHASASVGAAVSILVWRKREGIIACVLALLVAFSRMYLCVHYPSDVLAGILLGILFGLGAALLVNLLTGKWKRIRGILKYEKSWITFLPERWQKPVSRKWQAFAGGFWNLAGKIGIRKLW